MREAIEPEKSETESAERREPGFSFRFSYLLSLLIAIVLRHWAIVQSHRLTDYLMKRMRKLHLIGGTPD